MSSGLIEIMKRAAIDAQEAGQPCDLRTGTVKSVSPLSIQVSSQLILPEGLLIVPRSLTDYEVEVTPVSWVTETKSYSVNDEDAFASHNHSITGRKTMTIHNTLKVGDKVALIRKHGGQFFYVLDRI